MKRICLLLALSLLLCACGAKEAPAFVKVIETYPSAASADFDLPEGSTLQMIPQRLLSAARMDR